MNLILDTGNTSTKAAIFDNAMPVKKERLLSANPKTVSGFTEGYVIEKAIISSVIHDTTALLKFLQSSVQSVHLLTWRSHFPFEIDYETPETLGTDRLAAAAGVLVRHPGSDILVIDAGSALTVDLVTGGVFRGGSISPGLSMRFRALHEYTGRLPLIAPSKEFSFPGRSTEDAIAGGVLMGIVYEINEYIRTFGKKHKNLITVITGGDGQMIASHAGRKIFHYPDLVAEGLNYLLDTNA
jgi:type III pantothenate kinase